MFGGGGVTVVAASRILPASSGKVVSEHQGKLHPLYTLQKNSRGVRSGELGGRSSVKAASVSLFPRKLSSPRNTARTAVWKREGAPYSFNDM